MWFYKTLYRKSLFTNSPHSSNEKILAQDAVRIIISGYLNHFNFETSAISEDVPGYESESDSEGTSEYVNKNNNNYCKLLQFLAVKSKIEILSIFSKFICGADRKSANISNQDEEASPLEEASISTVLNTLNSIANITINNTPVLIIQTTTETETEISNLTNEIGDNEGLLSSESSASSTSIIENIVYHDLGLHPTPRRLPINPDNTINPLNPLDSPLPPLKYTE